MATQRKSQVLIVDDYPTNIKVLSDLLIEYGFEVLIARDGENALQKLQKISPDLILLDVLMPGIDGFETCRRLKAQDSTRNIPVVFMTALSDPVDKIKGLTLGAVDYITKPFQQEEVLARINTHLKLRYLTRQLEEQNAQLQEEARSRQIAEVALRFSEEKFAKAFRSNPGPMAILTLAEGRFIEVNQNFCNILGYQPEAVLGRRLEEMHLWVDPADCDRFRQLLQSQGAIQKQEYSIHTQAGEVRCFLVSAEVIQVREVPCILAMMTDITECKEATAALEQAKAAADRANQAKSQFLANISHELRSPLNTILGYVRLMGRDPTLSPEQQDNLAILNRSGDHLLTLINDVLEMAKIEAGQLTLQEVAVDLHSLLSAVYGMLEPHLLTKNVQFTLEQAPEIPQYVHTDATKLRQVLMNLVGNGLKFTEQGQVRLRVGVRPATEEAASAIAATQVLTFTVEDTGPGIASEEIEGLFDPFVQTESGRRSQEGTGLGLSISQRFVQLMGSQITVQSQVGVGSVFSFEIPVTLVDAAEVVTTQPQRQVVGLAAGQPTYRVLIVDDQTANRQLLVKLLTAVGFEVRQAENGESAIAQFQSWQPQFIWMDVRLPDIDGYEVTRRLKRLAEAEAIPVPKIVTLTASAFEENRQTAIAAGCDDFVCKPIREDVLFDIMARHLGVAYLYQGIGSSPVAPRTGVNPPAINPMSALTPSVQQGLRDLVMDDEAFLLTYLNDHLEQLPQLLQAIQTALAQANTRDLALAAHTLKGIGMTFGAERLTELSRAIEHAAGAGPTAISQEQLRALEAEINRLIAAIEWECEQIDPS